MGQASVVGQIVQRDQLKITWQQVPKNIGVRFMIIAMRGIRVFSQQSSRNLAQRRSGQETFILRCAAAWAMANAKTGPAQFIASKNLVGIFDDLTKRRLKGLDMPDWFHEEPHALVTHICREHLLRDLPFASELHEGQDVREETRRDGAFQLHVREIGADPVEGQDLVVPGQT